MVGAAMTHCVHSAQCMSAASKDKTAFYPIQDLDRKRLTNAAQQDAAKAQTENISVHLDEIVNWIDRAFGEEFQEFAPEQQRDIENLRQLLGSEGYQRHFRDQVNRQIIRDYLTNAVVLGVISEGGLAAFARQIDSEDGRATLALYMLMSSVEDARDLPPVNGEVEALKPLRVEKPIPGDRSHIKLVP